MRVLFKDVERNGAAVHNTTALNGRSITDSYSFSPRIKSKTVEWVRPQVETYSDKIDFENIPEDIKTIVWTDRAPLFYFGFNTTIWTLYEYAKDRNLYNLDKNVPQNMRHIHMLLEPPDGCGESYNFHKMFPEFSNKFDIVLSHNKELCEKVSNCLWYPWGTSLLDSENEFVIYPKTKLVSFNYSFKKWWFGHKFRFETGELLKSNNRFNFIDITGPLEQQDYIPKIDTLRDYHYSIQIENQKVDDFFSDKIIDSFLTGTIPIYYGTDNIGNYFNKNGIITFNTQEELLDILANLTTDYYYKNIDAINENYLKAKEYVSPDDWILKNYGNKVFI